MRDKIRLSTLTKTSNKLKKYYNMNANVVKWETLSVPEWNAKRDERALESFGFDVVKVSEICKEKHICKVCVTSANGLDDEKDWLCMPLFEIDKNNNSIDSQCDVRGDSPYIAVMRVSEAFSSKETAIPYRLSRLN